MESFEEIKELVLHYVRGIWKNRWIAIAIAWPVLFVGVIVVDQIKDRYEAETKVYIDTSSVLKPLLKGLAVQSDFESNVRLMVKKLLSRPNLERAIRLMDMDINVESKLEQEKLIERVKEKVSISTRRRTGIYTISYEDTNPRRAKRMVQTLLDIFVEDTLGNSAEDSDSAISFLDKQIAKYDKLLQEAEQRVEIFKRENVGVMPKDGANYYKQLQAITSQYEEARLELNETVQRRDKLRSQLNELTIEKTVEATSSQYDVRISKLESDLDDLLLSYTDAHPDVVNTRRIIETLKKKREAEIKGIQQGVPSSRFDNPVYQQLQVLLSEAEANISSLTARTAAYKKKMAQLKKLVDIVPKIESELQRLNRDYEVHKKNYNALVARREQARISEDVDTGTKQVKFRIIEPPRVPTKPSFPNRPLFDAIVLLLALGIGYGISLLLSLAKPVFYNTKDLRDYTGLPVLGSVMKFDTDKVLTKRRRNIYLFVLANILLVAVTAIIMYLHSQHVLILSSLQIKLMSFI
jgi:polysaccharide chain length determinant protein (PEP-CTERM system associated)